MHKQQDYQQDVNLAQSQAMQDFLKKVNDIVKTIATKEKYDIILQKDAVPFSTDKVNITKEVIKQLG